MADEIIEASSPADYQAFGALIQEYVNWFASNCNDPPWFVEQTFKHQSLSQELANLSTLYGPPNGKALLAIHDGQTCGGVGYRKLSNDICEMKRLFVSDRFHGNGTGRRLCEAIMADARSTGFSLMRLDTAIFLQAAKNLYRSLGFVSCQPYRDYPEKLRPFIVFMEKPLTAEASKPT